MSQILETGYLIIIGKLLEKNEVLTRVLLLKD